MRKVLLFLFLTLTLPLHATNYNIPHIADQNWNTSITILNTNNIDVRINLKKWESNFENAINLSFTISPNSKLVLNNSNFGYNGMCMINSESKLNVKLTYGFIGSESVCQFYIDENKFSTDWLIANPSYEEFAWFGMAMGNFTDNNKDLSINIYKNGLLQQTIAKTILPFQKLTGTSNQLFDNLDYKDFDLITVHCEKGIELPIMISGNVSQDRHIFLKGQEVELKESIQKEINVIHIADLNWETTLTVYNSSHLSGNFQIKNGCIEEGCENSVYTVAPYNFLKLKGGVDFTYNGSAVIEGDPTLTFKLSYRFKDSSSICDFFLERQKGVQWLISGENLEQYDWMGFALSNTSNEEAYVSVLAYKDGEIIDSHAFSMDTNEKYVTLFSSVFPDSTIKDIDYLMFTSDTPITAPISIVGNNGQSRHIFSNASVIKESNNIFKILSFTDGLGTITPLGLKYYYPGESESYIITPNMGYGVGKLLYDNNQMGFYTHFNLTSLGANHTLKAVFSKNINIPDPQFKRRLTSNYDLDNDGQISEEEALEVSGTMYLGGLNITSLSGIEYFLNITKLYCQNNYLKSLNVSALKKLKILDCSNNEITSLNVKGLELMEELNCNNNKIKEIDITALWSLKYFYSEGNLFENFDFSNNVNLVELNCKTNKLTILSLINLKKLKDLNCSDNLISNFYSTNLDSLWSADFHNNQLSWLYLDNYLSLHELYCNNNKLGEFAVNNLVNLVHFDCSNNKIGNIPDLSNATNLVSYKCFGNLFETDDCPLINTHIGLGLQEFIYNPQKSGMNLLCP